MQLSESQDEQALAQAPAMLVHSVIQISVLLLVIGLKKTMEVRILMTWAEQAQKHSRWAEQAENTHDEGIFRVNSS